MRARRLTDGGSARVALPPCVTIGADLVARCSCGSSQDLAGLDRALAERQLGEFARFHKRHGPKAASGGRVPPRAREERKLIG